MAVLNDAPHSRLSWIRSVIALVGISHKTAPVEVRERLAFTSEELLLLLPGLRQRFGPAVVLSMAKSRLPVYLDGVGGDLGFREVVAHLVLDRQTGISAEDEQFYALEGVDAVRHLYRVAAGLESMVLGESQILGQVRDALHTAQKAGVVDTLLERLFQSALSAGRRIRAGAGIAGAKSPSGAR